MTYEQWLGQEEALRYPIYGTLLQKRKSFFGFFGLTEEELLIALLQDNQREIQWTSRIPLDLKNVVIKKSMIPLQYVIYLEFNEGAPCKIRVSKKVYGIPGQEENVTAFMAELAERV